ncbi:unnamed protein product [Amoebophrya sp. A25]|nr:unnamed protein product [Amoebophrya sp. A25]|eukprot:GSA25T00025758001.1
MVTTNGLSGFSNLCPMTGATSFQSLGLHNFAGAEGHDVARHVLKRQYRYDASSGSSGVQNWLSLTKGRGSAIGGAERYLRRIGDTDRGELYACTSEKDDELIEKGECAYLGDALEVAANSQRSGRFLTVAAQKWTGQEWTRSGGVPFVVLETKSQTLGGDASTTTATSADASSTSSTTEKASRLAFAGEDALFARAKPMPYRMITSDLRLEGGEDYSPIGLSSADGQKGDDAETMTQFL